ncbi:lipase-like PAD4 isoform X2 [Mercurialis annua]|uniref:lipase-like PAD4 isoform X2 n=1 Tax=Mercurialis annua TaxID=3986 RepID=UPI00215F39D2|nr:lipase-like PAD4 isoform X2 [Mercurialis annua]
METEVSAFESSEMVSCLLASTPLLTESWRLCDLASASSFVAELVGSTGYAAFFAAQLEESCAHLEPLPRGLFFPLHHQTDQDEAEEPLMVHSGFLRLFLSIYSTPTFQNQMLSIMQKSKCVVITGYSTGATLASLCALWLLSYLQSISSTLSVLCITFGSPLLANRSLSRAILRQRWAGNFCHVVSKHDIVPRLLFAPQLHSFRSLAADLPNQTKAEILHIVLASLDQHSETSCCFWPFGNYLFCSEDGGICIENVTCVIKMMHLLLSTSSPTSCIQDHLNYGYYIGKLSFQFLSKRSFQPAGVLPDSSYDAGVALALQSSGIACQEPVARPAEDCLKLARPMGRTPNLNCANLAIKLSEITPYRAEIEWYKASCDLSDDQMGYYDSFKQRGASKRDYKVNMNRHKLAQFWDCVIRMLENNQLPHDFQMRAKWVNAAQFYKLLVEPLDIAEYYRTGMHRTKGHYIGNGREKRYRIFDRWWKTRGVQEEEQNRRSKYASLTQDTCFWASVEEAREWLDRVRSENDPTNLALLWESIERFERYGRELVERKEVSKDVVARNSSYCVWVKDYNELKSQVARFCPRFPSLMNGEVVP